MHFVMPEAPVVLTEREVIEANRRQARTEFMKSFGKSFVIGFSATFVTTLGVLTAVAAINANRNEDSEDEDLD
ncbi:hypothetical protein PP914_gp060 [Arthrobacter phage Qui]|uniref:Uncharacterized protein n=1 Tax=Arthrobacter phage Qui TaxID=2603260 RepID=A0A5B8WFI5_9CAUD|nr:hypothetical protein PP914_gp060 [Arthrobacter phage Qui]QED11550.1 hypothetical protein SEA_QUI_60 [Arthrobacter phage Qui]QOC56382.1 hypothetical protein SEA_PAELLA_60 [Arthrobacter phage Paella]